MALFRNPSEYSSYKFNQNPNDYWSNLSRSFGRYPWDMPAAATEAAIRGQTPMLSMPAAATENTIRGIDKPVQGPGSMFYNAITMRR